MGRGGRRSASTKQPHKDPDKVDFCSHNFDHHAAAPLRFDPLSDARLAVGSAAPLDLDLQGDRKCDGSGGYTLVRQEKFSDHKVLLYDLDLPLQLPTEPRPNYSPRSRSPNWTSFNQALSHAMKMAWQTKISTMAQRQSNPATDIRAISLSNLHCGPSPSTLLYIYQEIDQTVRTTRLRHLWRRQHEFFTFHTLQTSIQRSQARRKTASRGPCLELPPRAQHTSRPFSNGSTRNSPAIKRHAANCCLASSPARQRTKRLYHWLARDRQTTPLTGILHQGRPLSRDAIHDATVDFWRQIWPSHTPTQQRPRSSENTAQPAAAPNPARRTSSTNQSLRSGWLVRQRVGRAPWICDTLPSQLHGGLRNKGLHAYTALPDALIKLEAQLLQALTEARIRPFLPSSARPI